MGLAKYALAYHPTVRADMAGLSPFWRTEVSAAILAKLTTHPSIFGAPLRQLLRGYRKLRVGDYRVIYQIEKATVRIFIIDHRSVVYKEMLKRIG